MQWQLRMYRVKDGELDTFVREWRDHIAPLRRSLGFDVVGPWLTDDGQFVWLVAHEELEAAEAAYYASPERAALDPDPARNLTDIRTWLMEEL
ncbi:MAG TPA: NIPSNAP family protein [Gaiellaceae bacterium]|nr:NIPSNAP family protein [Gaiellaceae bacterium]